MYSLIYFLIPCSSPIWTMAAMNCCAWEATNEKLYFCAGSTNDMTA